MSNTTEMGLMASVFTLIDNSSKSRQSVTKITIILADRLAEIVVSATVGAVNNEFHRGRNGVRAADQA